MIDNQPRLTANAKRFALIVRLLFARQGLTGKLANVTRGARHLSLAVRLADPVKLDNALKLAEPLALASGVNAVLAQRIEGVISYQFELKEMYWLYFTRQDVTGLAVGLAEQRRPVNFTFDPPHALIAGTTGSGKSETLKSILVALMTNYRPDELGVIVCDPHNDYQDFHNEAHLLMPVVTEPAGIKNALLWANQELAHRKENNIKDGQTIIVAVDEADTALADSTALEIAQIISKQARKYRIHLLIATQKPLHGKLPGILDNLMNKFVGQLVDAHTSARVTGHAGLQAHKLTPKGDFLHITGPQVNRFQVAMATQADFTRLERGTNVQKSLFIDNPVDLPPELPERGPGRPQLQVNPEYAAWYFFHNPDKISRAMAREFGLTRDNHELHQSFVRDFIKAYLKLRHRQLGA